MNKETQAFMDIVILAVIGLVFLIAMTLIASSHEWYDKWCCDGKDCGPVEKEPPSTKGGYLINGQIFPFDKVRASKDNRWHVCIWGGKVRCVYAPMSF